LALSQRPHHGQEHELVDEVVAVYLPAGEFGRAGDDAGVGEFDVGAHVAEDVNDGLVALDIGRIDAGDDGSTN
ncbi:hypothetical protein LCGC14_2894300, partial [marine sediment metagenome]